MEGSAGTSPSAGHRAGCSCLHVPVEAALNVFRHAHIYRLVQHHHYISYRVWIDVSESGRGGMVVETATKPETGVQDSVSTFVSVKTPDTCSETLTQGSFSSSL